MLRHLKITMPLLLIGSCMSVQSAGICDATMLSRDRLTVALIEDGGPESRMAGASLISQLDAGCRDV